MRWNPRSACTTTTCSPPACSSQTKKIGNSGQSSVSPEGDGIVTREGVWIAEKDGVEIARSPSSEGVIRILDERQIRGAITHFLPAVKSREDAIQKGAEAIVGEYYDILAHEGVDIATDVLDAAHEAGAFLYTDEHELLHNHAAARRISDRDYRRCREEVEELEEKLQNAPHQDRRAGRGAGRGAREGL